MEFKRCLLGVPSGSDQNSINQMRSLIEYAVGLMSDAIEVATTVVEYENELFTGQYDLTVCVDNMGYGAEYSEIARQYGYYRVRCIAIIPYRCKGDTYLTRFVDAGLTRIILENDVTVYNLHNLIYDERTRDEALMYLGIDFRPVKIEREVESETRKSTSSVNGGTVVKRTYLKDGMAVTRMCGQDIGEVLGGKSEHLDDVLSSVFGDDLDGIFGDDADTELSNAGMPYKEFKVDEPWVGEFKVQLSKYFTGLGLRSFQLYKDGAITREAFEAKVIEQLNELKVYGDAVNVVLDSYMKDLSSYGRLDPLITAEDVSDVRLMSKDVINVQYKGVWYRTNVSFETDEEYRSFIGQMCQRNEAATNLQELETIFTDTHTYAGLNLRITVTHGRLSSGDNYGSHIRIATKEKRTAARLLSDGFFMSKMQALVLIQAIKNKKSILICGGSGSGKTILLNMLIEHFDPSICGTCIQESDELHSETHRNIEFLHSITKAGESKQGYTLKQLATTSLLKNAELFIIGEIKGAEAAEFMNASRTSRVYATTHAEDFTGAIPRITELSKEVADYSQEEIMKILSKSIHYVVYCEKYRCKQVAKVVGYDAVRKDIIYDLYDFNAKE